MKNNIVQVAHDACTGCGACFNKCPVKAISMRYDKEGFLYPFVDEEKCINCGQCVNVCAALHPLQLHDTPKSYAVWAADEVRLVSSSGGMFTLLAEYVLEHQGIVCGAVYADDYLSVYHTWAETKEELAALRSSKYVQSDTRETYKEAETYLNNGRMVLYTGCPCQIAGLYSYLGGDRPNLITADLVCHGANSLTAYKSFIREFSEGKDILKVDFRDKKFFEWSSPTVIYLKDGSVKKASWDQGTWYKGFLNGVITRMSCFECSYARSERVADITLGDCWQVHRINPKYDDRKGTSLVLPNSDKGMKLLKVLVARTKLCEEIPLQEIRKYNGHLNKPTKMHPSRKFFFSHLNQLGYHNSLWYGLGWRYDIGIVGWWFASNYGSSLTYYALGTLLESWNRQVLFIPIPKLDGTPWEKETEQTIGFISRYFHVGKNRDIGHMKEFNKFCDAFMLGSDQMWTAGTTDLVGYTFFLDFVEKNKKKIAFSTSFGHDKFYGSREMCETAGDYLKNFDAISVREKSGVDICRENFGVDAQQVLDPVFLVKREQYDLMLNNVTDKIPDKKYLLCYILDPTKEKEQAAKKIAEHENLEIITILGMKEYNYAIKLWNTGTVLPRVTTEQFLFYIKNCEFLLTDSHHGVCFGIIYKRQYAALVNANRGKTRFVTVAEVLHLEDRLIDNPLDILHNEKIYEKINYDSVEYWLKDKKEEAFKWLKFALTCPVKQGIDTVRTINEENKQRSDATDNRLNDIEARLKRIEEKERTFNNLLETNNELLELLRQYVFSVEPTVKNGPKLENLKRKLLEIKNRFL